tara:strand:+ start:9427 stop:11157 length:1731 start_codon:yes stop_codon:yes gene_type:complete
MTRHFTRKKRNVSKKIGKQNRKHSKKHMKKHLKHRKTYKHRGGEGLMSALRKKFEGIPINDTNIILNTALMSHDDELSTYKRFRRNEKEKVFEYGFSGPEEKEEEESIRESGSTSEPLLSQGERSDKPSKKQILYVIDMQKDFIDEHHKGLTGLNIVVDGNSIGHLGAFAVNNGGRNLLEDDDGLIQYLTDNLKNYDTIIFTKDLHDPNHCSFVSEGGTFPPHCVIGTKGAHFDDRISKWIKDNQSGNEHKIKILFKGMHPNVDSFSAEKYKNDPEIYKKRQIGKKCYGSSLADEEHKEIHDHDSGCGNGCTGSYIYTGENAIDYVGDVDQKWENIKNDFTLFQLFTDGTGQNTEIHVCGLAGDFCVRDTALSLKDKYKDARVCVLHDFTRNAFVPLSVPLTGTAYDKNTRYGSGKLEVSHLDGESGKLADIMGSEPTGIVTRSIQTISGKRGNRKGLQHYIFQFTPPSTYTVLSGKDADCLKKFRTNFKVTLDPLYFNDGSEFFHFVSDPRQIIDDYRNAGIKLLTRYESKQDFLDKKKKELKKGILEEKMEIMEIMEEDKAMNPMQRSSKGSEE